METIYKTKIVLSVCLSVSPICVKVFISFKINFLLTGTRFGLINKSFLWFPLGFSIDYRPQTKFAKVMFSQVSLCPQGGDACPIACWDTHMHTQAETPLGQTHSPRQTPPLGRHPLGRCPPAQCILGYTHTPQTETPRADTPRADTQCMLG